MEAIERGASTNESGHSGDPAAQFLRTDQRGHLWLQGVHDLRRFGQVGGGVAGSAKASA
jgi:hypothetical protein